MLNENMGPVEAAAPAAILASAGDTPHCYSVAAQGLYLGRTPGHCGRAGAARFPFYTASEQRGHCYDPGSQTNGRGLANPTVAGSDGRRFRPDGETL